MRTIHDSQTRRLLAGGQTFMIVMLLIMVMGLTGFTVYLYFKYDAAVIELKGNVADQGKKVGSVKDGFEELSQQVKSQKDSLSEQKDKLYGVEKQSSVVKKMLEDVQSNIKKEIDVIKEDNQKSMEVSQASLSKIEKTLDGFTDQVKKLKEGVKDLAAPAATVVPVVDVKVEPQVPVTKAPAAKGKAKEAKK